MQYYVARENGTDRLYAFKHTNYGPMFSNELGSVALGQFTRNPDRFYRQTLPEWDTCPNPEDYTALEPSELAKIV